MNTILGLSGVIVFVFGLFGLFVPDTLRAKSRIPGALLCAIGVGIFLFWM